MRRGGLRVPHRAAAVRLVGARLPVHVLPEACRRVHLGSGRIGALLTRYRFGYKTADFVFCGRCGGYLGAITEEDGAKLAVLNIHALDPLPAGLPPEQPMSYEGESTGDRNSRRGKRWTPVVG